MNLQSFLHAVQTRAHLPSTEHALVLTRSTLKNLARRLPDGEPKKLRSELPRRLRRTFRETPQAEERFDANEFLERVSIHEGVRETKAAQHTRIVLQVLKDCVSKEAFTDLKRKLPEGYARFFPSNKRRAAA